MHRSGVLSGLTLKFTNQNVKTRSSQRSYCSVSYAIWLLMYMQLSVLSLDRLAGHPYALISLQLISVQLIHSLGDLPKHSLQLVTLVPITSRIYLPIQALERGQIWG